MTPRLSHQKTAKPTTFIQPKLMVNAPNDVYEQEADAVADRVMRMPLVSSKAQGTQGMLASSVQRKCAHCEEEEKKKMPVMRKAEGGGSFETSPQFSSQLSNTRGGGHAMPTGTQSFMENRFGRDFSHVRLHTDGTAANMSAGIQAKAFTHGSDIYFNRGEFQPNTEGGTRLLAHELTHTVQQERGIGSEVQKEDMDAGVPHDASLPGGVPQEPALLNPAPQLQRTSQVVYMCSKDLDTSPIGKHAFFRVGGAGAGNPTYSLQPIDSSLGVDCWQGMPYRNYPDDISASGECEATAISVSCLETEFDLYPIGHYCTFGPNSNTFVGHIARRCGIANPDPSGYTPGIDRSPPPSGTFAPSPMTTLGGCTTKRCVIDSGGPPQPIIG